MSNINELLAKPGSSCTLCKDSTSDDHHMGQLLSVSNDNNAYHHYCLLFSSGLRQEGEDEEGILGFLPQDINKEVFRGKKLACSHCGKRGATVGCFNGRCRKSYHMSCGLKHSAQFSFLGEFRSWCEDHRMLQKGPGMGSLSQCQICLDDLPADPKAALWAPCCQKDLWYHKHCMQSLAISSGYYFKCPMCNDKKTFVRTMQQFGIYVPEKDASWELEPNAYDDLLERPSHCEAALCLSDMGRDYDKEHTPWDILYCELCGSSGIHKKCMAWVGFNVWQCNDCIQHTADITKRDRLKYQEEMKKLEEEKKEKEDEKTTKEESDVDTKNATEVPAVHSNKLQMNNASHFANENCVPEENPNFELHKVQENSTSSESVKNCHRKLFNINQGDESDVKNEVFKNEVNIIKEEKDLVEENDANNSYLAGDVSLKGSVIRGVLSDTDDDLEISFKSACNEGNAIVSEADLSIEGSNRKIFTDIPPLSPLVISDETLEKFGSESLLYLLKRDDVPLEIIQIKEEIISILKRTIELRKSTYSLGKLFLEFGQKAPSNTVYYHFMNLTMKLTDIFSFAKVIHSLIEFARMRILQARKRRAEKGRYKNDPDAILFMERNKQFVNKHIRKAGKRLRTFLRNNSPAMELLSQTYPVEDDIENLDWRRRIALFIKQNSDLQLSDENVIEGNDETASPTCDEKMHECFEDLVQNGTKRLSSDNSLQSLTNRDFDSVGSSRKKFKCSDSIKTTQSSITSFFTK